MILLFVEMLFLHFLFNATLGNRERVLLGYSINANAGLQHIISRHGAEFAKAGISKGNIPKFIMQAILTGRKVGMQGSRPIYETTFNGTTHRVAVTVGNNGFVVGANMVSK